MPFNSIPYILIFPAALLIHYLIPQRFRYVWLLVVSASFYLLGGGTLVAILGVSIVITYLTGLALYSFESKAAKKFVVVLSVIAEFATLFVFKYLDFTLDLLGSGLRFNLLLPLGISFYTFQAVSYIVDVYREKIPAELNIIKLALYLSYFASIVSGPINRAGDMLPQFSSPAPFDLDNIKRGMQKMIWGYFLKLAIAGRLAIVVDNVYKDASGYTGFSVAFAAVSYMFMLYCDFEGYSQIALGSSQMLGITMKENFRQPFMSETLSQIWRRWHVSLYSWFRDYLYIPLGGSRCSAVRKYLNVFIVMFLSGIWHGANLTFFAWGAINGLFIVIGQITSPVRERVAGNLRDRLCKSGAAGSVFDRIRVFLRRVGTFILFSYTFIYFANDGITSAYIAVKTIITRFFAPGAVSELFTLGLGRFNLVLTAIMAIFVLVADNAAYKKDCDTPSLIKNIPVVWRWVIYYALVIAILFSANLSGKEFIYANM